ncbi:MAG: hypothetical protein L0221_07625 [Chloroflexi bacterium]|nr:hypothetical protein [Chloroflexota bacterium]
MKNIRTALGGILVIVLLAACAGAAASGTPGDGSSREPGGPTDVPGDPGRGGGGTGGGGAGGNPGTGVVDPGIIAPPPNPLPGDDGATIVEPVPGQLDPMPAFVSGLLVNVDGRHVTVRLSWSSGVEPCYVLDSVRTDRDGNTITLTVLEGHGPGDNVCIEIALLKATIVDLGELEPGTYVIQARGDAAPVTIVVA